MEKAVIILSGGMDSGTLLGKLIYEGNYDVYPITFNYGQRHVKEIEAAENICKWFSLRHRHQIIELPIKFLLSNSALTGSTEVPEGHYAEESMKQTVVPNRNMIMLSIALGYAINIKARKLFYGAHAGDHDIYPDCRPEFVAAMQNAAELCDYHMVDIEAPFLHMDKGDIAKYGIARGFPYQLTWTCYKGRDKACGKCGACRERLEAFEKAERKDPLRYDGDPE